MLFYAGWCLHAHAMQLGFPRGHLRPCTHDVDSVKQDPPFPGTMAFHVPTAKMPTLCIITSGIWLPVIKSGTIFSIVMTRGPLGTHGQHAALNTTIKQLGAWH